MSLVGKKAPHFRTDAVIDGGEFVEDFSLDQYLGKQYVIFYFYPMDFTFVCPTEILAFQKKLQEFEKRNCAVVGCSVDSKFSHWAWLNTPQEKGGIQGVTYPLVADFSKTIAENYGVLAGNYEYSDEGYMTFNGNPVALRGTFLIDKEGIVRHALINDLPLGRNIDEAIRMVDSLAHFEDKGEVCPANWEEGDEAMVESHESVSGYLAKNKS
ncbi:MAG: peroxiredoxin [Sphingobacteriales bacterium]|nr:MAG: peroxiredoxin [Sphingobacteriales bacterium]